MHTLLNCGCFVKVAKQSIQFMYTDDEDEETGIWQKTFYLCIRSYCAYRDVLKVFRKYDKILSPLCLEYKSKDINFFYIKFYSGISIIYNLIYNQ